jgi:hypothetical protein
MQMFLYTIYSCRCLKQSSVATSLGIPSVFACSQIYCLRAATACCTLWVVLGALGCIWARFRLAGSSGTTTSSNSSWEMTLMVYVSANGEIWRKDAAVRLYRCQ